MKKTFDELFNEIVGEAIVNTQAPQQQQNQQQQQQNQQQPQQNQQNQQQPQQNQQKYQQNPTANNPQSQDLDKLAAEMAKMQDASKIKALLDTLLNPKPGNNA